MLTLYISFLASTATTVPRIHKSWLATLAATFERDTHLRSLSPLKAILRATTEVVLEEKRRSNAEEGRGWRRVREDYRLVEHWDAECVEHFGCHR